MKQMSKQNTTYIELVHLSDCAMLWALLRKLKFGAS